MMKQKSARSRPAAAHAVSTPAAESNDPSALAAGLTARGVIGIALLALAAQFPSLGGGGIWDDQIMIFENERIHAADGLYRFWFTTEQSDYWPLSYSTHWLEWRLWGNWAPGYRAVNLVLHALCAVLVWRVLARLRVPAPWLCGAVFASHPLALEAVAWTFQRKTVLSTALVFASLACYLLYEDERRRRWYAGAVVLFLLAILAKSAVVMWPFVLLLLGWWRRRTITWHDLWRAAPFFAISFVFGLIGMWFQTNVSIAHHADIVRTDPLWARTAIAGCAVWFYLYKALLPIHLSFVYPRWELAEPSVVAFLPGVAVVAVLAVCWRFRHSWGAAPGVAFGYYLLNLFPVLGFITIYFMRFSYVADHWQYLALPSVIALVVGSLAHLLATRAAFAIWGRLAAAAAIGLLVVASFDQAKIYGAPDNVPLWYDTLDKNPDAWLAHNNLARLLSDRGDYAQAMVHLREAVRLDPTQRPIYQRALLAAGIDAARRGQHDAAVLHFQHALELDRQSEEAYLHLGRELFLLRRGTEALATWRQGVEQLPEANTLAAALAWVLATHPDASVRDPQRAVELAAALCRRSRNKDASHLDVLAAAYAAAGRFDDAVKTAAEAVELARGSSNTSNAADLEARLKLYQSGRSYVSP